MSARLSDTAPEIEALQIEGLRRMEPWQKLALLEGLNRTVRALAWAGLRQRYPDDPPERLRRRMADLLLGPELAVRVYGPGPEEC